MPNWMEQFFCSRYPWNYIVFSKGNAFHISYTSAAWNSTAFWFKLPLVKITYLRQQAVGSTPLDFQEALSLQPSNSGMASCNGKQGDGRTGQWRKYSIVRSITSMLLTGRRQPLEVKKVGRGGSLLISCVTSCQLLNLAEPEFPNL